MPDINLTRDTEETPSEEKKERKVRLEYTDPERSEKRDDEQGPPSNFLVWLKGLFARTPPGEGEDEPDTEIKPKKPEMSDTEKEQVEDIFAAISKDERGAEKDGKQGRDAKVVITETKKQEEPEKRLKRLPEEKKKKKGKKDQEEDFGGVNLLPEEFSTKFDIGGKGSIIGLAALAAVVFIALVYGGLLLYESSIVKRTRVATETRQQIEAQLETLRDAQKRSIAFEDRLEVISALLDQHVYWTKFFSLLEKYTVDDVYFDGGIRLSSPGQFTLKATGRDYQALVEQLQAFRTAVENKEFISSVAITEADLVSDSSGVSRSSFTVDLVLLPNVNTYTTEEYADAVVNQPLQNPVTAPLQ